MQVPEFNCSTVDELRLHLAQFASGVGFDSYGFVLELRPTEADASKRLQFLANTGPVWQQSIGAALASGEPRSMVRHAVLQLPPVGWSVKGQRAGHTIVDDLAMDCLRSMGDRPVRAGVLCPIFAPEVTWGALMLFSRRTMRSAELKAVLPRCALYALNFCFWYLQITHRRVQGKRTLLSQRETECLNHAAVGKTSAQIGKLLDISARTVEGYISAACNKLNARGRQAAISRAYELDLLGGRNALKAVFERQRDMSLQARDTEYENLHQ